MGRSLILLLFISSFLQAQYGIQKDLLLLKSPPASTSNKGLNNQAPIQPKRNGFLVQINPVRLLLTGSMLVYQNVITQQLSSGCLYQRTCSNYAKEAIHMAGLVRGVLLAADRLTRCNTAAMKEVPFIYFDEKGKIIDEPCIHFDH